MSRFVNSCVLVPLLAFALTVVTGCGGGLGTGSFSPTAVSSGTAISGAIAQCDKNANGTIDADELANCPAIAGDLARFDTSGDQAVSAEELTAQWESMFASSAQLLSVSCTVTDGRKALSGVKVDFVPEEFQGGDLQPATGTTDETGRAYVGIDENLLSARQKSAKLCQVGVYRVRLSGPGIPEGLKEAGFEVNPVRRGGTDAAIDISKLK